jgi:hypothetical protein
MLYSEVHVFNRFEDLCAYLGSISPLLKEK